MEGGRVRALSLVLVLGMLVGSSEASFPLCYLGCFGKCFLRSGSALECALFCVPKCIIPPSFNPTCFSQVFGECRSQHHGVFKCVIRAFRDCKRGVLGEEPDYSHYFCKLGCALNSCTSISTQENPAVEEVTRCVDACSEMCPENRLSP